MAGSVKVVGIVITVDMGEEDGIATASRDADYRWTVDGALYPRYLQLVALIDDACKATDKGQRVGLEVL
jgi:hypothetical protein